MMSYEPFIAASTIEVAQQVRSHGPQVCVFPINGTRRWFELEYPNVEKEHYFEQYKHLAGKQHVVCYQLCFEHGLDTLVTPILGADILERDEDYLEFLVNGMLHMVQGADFTDFYHRYQVRVRFYGEHEQYLRGTRYEPLLHAFKQLEAETRAYTHYRLFIGLFANDATETVARIGAEFYRQHHALPSRRQIIEAYYGDYIDPVSLFIGFDRPTAFDMPLIATGNEDLYFMVSPSLYLDAPTLRAILYDHLYARRVDDTDYDELQSADRQWLADFYTRNRRNVLGVGRIHPSGKFWYPLPQVDLA